MTQAIYEKMGDTRNDAGMVANTNSQAERTTNSLAEDTLQRSVKRRVFDFIVRSATEAACSDGGGYWNNVHGWTDFSSATRFTESETKTLNLPNATGQDAKWISISDCLDCAEKLNVKTVKMKLTLDLELDLHDEEVSLIRSNLESIIVEAMGCGSITGHSTATVSDYSFAVSVE